MALFVEVESVEKEVELIEEVKYLLNFLKSSERGISRGSRENG